MGEEEFKTKYSNKYFKKTDSIIIYSEEMWHLFFFPCTVKYYACQDLQLKVLLNIL